jgi:hypothetical protein
MRGLVLNLRSASRRQYPVPPRGANTPFRLGARSASRRQYPVPPRGANTPFRLEAPFCRVVSYKPSEYLTRVLILAFASEYRSIMPMLGSTPCDLSCFRQRWLASTTLSEIPWFCA